ncbi:MAG: 50S ribosomal protein L18 [archaeon]
MKTVKRRRRENKTDYLKRLKMLKGEKPRIVFRKTNKYLIAQYVTNKNVEDKTEIGINSKILMKYGWPKEFENSLKSLSAAYLLGFLMGKRIVKEKKETPIIDLGMARIVHKTKLFAFMKGIVDLGVKIKHDEKTFPDENRIKGKNLKKDFSSHFEKIKSQMEKE